jgi:hypothetical protein
MVLGHAIVLFEIAVYLVGALAGAHLAADALGIATLNDKLVKGFISGFIKHEYLLQSDQVPAPASRAA